jgi:hypothetical protein
VLGKNFRIGDRIEVDIKNRVAVEDNLHSASLNGDLLLIPVAGFLEKAGLRREDVVERPVLLPGLNILVAFGIVVDDLKFHALVGDAARDQG